ncbi:MAG: alpha-L-fucosidase [Armatimonadota bacterium]|nr:alpha-L-fucosidase [Armatimonadota bacterium]
MVQVPSYLADYAEIYEDDPRAAALQWFREAKYGLFLHYGLYSLVGRHEWLQFREKIYVEEYARLMDDFRAESFDAELIADLALDCEMRYITITTRHHDSFCLFDTEETDFNAVNAPCGRDLIEELADACADRGLGLCLYYSHGRDWRHPHAPNNDRWGGNARPDYDPPEPTYAYGDDHDLQIYVEFVHNQIDELLTGYGPVAAIWLDGIAVPLQGPAEELRCQELYDFIHSSQPQVLISYKQGLLGTEDFFAPEHEAVETGGKPGEICTTMTPGSWGYMREKAGQHLTEQQVWEKLRAAGAAGYNLLLNTGPLGDGSIDSEDIPTLRRVGERIRSEGFPE